MIKAIILAVLLVIVSGGVALSGYGRVEKPAVRGTGPLAIQMPPGLSAPNYHTQPSAEWWRARHGERVASSGGTQECLGCHNPQTSCNNCHAYVGVQPIVVVAMSVPAPQQATATPVVAAALPTTAPATGVPTTAPSPTVVTAPSFAKDIAPILQTRCAACHGNYGGLDMSTYDRLMNSGDHKPVIIPGNSDSSLLIQKVRKQQTIGMEMPPGSPLSPDEIDLLVRWVAAGAANN